MSRTKYTVILPCGRVATRTSKRTYTHAVVVDSRESSAILANIAAVESELADIGIPTAEDYAEAAAMKAENEAHRARASELWGDRTAYDAFTTCPETGINARQARYEALRAVRYDLLTARLPELRSRLTCFVPSWHSRLELAERGANDARRAWQGSTVAVVEVATA